MSDTGEPRGGMPAGGGAGRSGGRHRRAADAPERCVCGARWAQAMTCHPCRQPGHRAADCVDGPGRLEDGRRVYPDDGAGRWCFCQHRTPLTGAAATVAAPVVRATTVTVMPGPGGAAGRAVIADALRPLVETQAAAARWVSGG